MRKKIVALTLCLLAAPFLYAEFFKLNLTRIGQDVYKETTTDIIVITKYCYEYVTYEDVILSFEEGSYDNKLHFENGQTCDVKEVR